MTITHMLEISVIVQLNTRAEAAKLQEVEGILQANAVGNSRFRCALVPEGDYSHDLCASVC